MAEQNNAQADDRRPTHEAEPAKLNDEVRKKEGSQNPPRSIHLLLAGLQREVDLTCSRFFERNSLY